MLRHLLSSLLQLLARSILGRLGVLLFVLQSLLVLPSVLVKNHNYSCSQAGVSVAIAMGSYETSDGLCFMRFLPRMKRETARIPHSSGVRSAAHGALWTWSGLPSDEWWLLQWPCSGGVWRISRSMDEQVMDNLFRYPHRRAAVAQFLVVDIADLFTPGCIYVVFSVCEPDKLYIDRQKRKCMVCPAPQSVLLYCSCLDKLTMLYKLV